MGSLGWKPSGTSPFSIPWFREIAEAAGDFACAIWSYGALTSQDLRLHAQVLADTRNYRGEVDGPQQSFGDNEDLHARFR